MMKINLHSHHIKRHYENLKEYTDKTITCGPVRECLKELRVGIILHLSDNVVPDRGA